MHIWTDQKVSDQIFFLNKKVLGARSEACVTLDLSAHAQIIASCSRLLSQYEA